MNDISELYKLPESKERAKKLGQSIYFTGKECKNKHLSARYVSSANCIKCIEEKRNVIFINIKKRQIFRSNENKNRTISALNKGEVTYISESPCPKNHFERCVTTNNCIACDEISKNKTKDLKRWNRIKKIYGITKEKYFEIVNVQNGNCAICELPLPFKNQHIDHCHKTNNFRGILCSKCNQAIGLFDKNIIKIKKAINYIENNI